MTVERGPGAVVHRRSATVLGIEVHSPGALLLAVALEGRERPDAAIEGRELPDADIEGHDLPERALAYTELVGEPVVGDRVLLNSTGMELRLGTGGVHFVIAILRNTPEIPFPGHLIKLRYTPHQCAIRAAEEEGSPHHEAADGEKDLDGTPVVACELHSQVPAAAAGFLARRPSGRVIYIHTSGAALPLSFSRLVPRMREAGLIRSVITAGQSFGGDLEAINLYSALLLARHALDADLVIVSQGPGNAGTGTRFGFSGIEQGEAANAAASLGGRPVVCLRASSADLRERHQSPSHHTLTVLDRVVRCRCAIPVARDAPGSRRRRILDALHRLGLQDRHDILEEERGAPGLELLAERGIRVTTMGRNILEDREFFLHACAAGAAAATMVERRAL